MFANLQYVARGADLQPYKCKNSKKKTKKDEKASPLSLYRFFVRHYTRHYDRRRRRAATKPPPRRRHSATTTTAAGATSAAASAVAAPPPPTFSYGFPRPLGLAARPQRHKHTVSL